MPLSSLHEQLLALSSLRGFGPARFAALYRHFGSAQAVCSASVASLQAAGCSLVQAQSIQQACAAPVHNTPLSSVHDWLQAAPHRRLIHIDDADYPPLLREIHDPPALLFVAGQPAVLQRPSVAIVGGRKASALALGAAEMLAAELADAGFNIVSGLALGVDAAAHRGALKVEGQSTAVYATGLDRCYPQRHQRLADALCRDGALISEMPLGTAPHPGLFPRRNRIVAGLAQATIVVEAGVKSGSLITAQLALDYDREVMAMPGQVTNPLARGCHALIKQGAALIENAQDVIALLHDHAGFGVASAPTTALPCPPASAHAIANSDATARFPASARAVLAILGVAGVISFDGLAAQAALPVAELQGVLLDLELDGWVAQVPGGYQIAKPVHLPA